MLGLYYWILNAEDVKELYDKMLDSVKVKRSMPPNAWLWSMIANCKHQPDIRLLFDILQNLRRFVSFYSFSFCCKLLLLLLFMVMIFNLFCKQRLSNLRIHDNFNCNLCREVAKACVHAGALDFGLCTLLMLPLLFFHLWNLKDMRYWGKCAYRNEGFVEA